jgi:hypothetical protein
MVGNWFNQSDCSNLPQVALWGIGSTNQIAAVDPPVALWGMSSANHLAAIHSQIVR